MLTFIWERGLYRRNIVQKCIPVLPEALTLLLVLVIPAEAGIWLRFMDPRLHGDDI